MSDSILSQGNTGDGDGDMQNADQDQTTQQGADTQQSQGTDTNQQSAEGGDKQGGDGGEDSKSGEGDARAPESYEAFNVPEGVTYDESVFEPLLAKAKDLDLTQDEAQSIVDTYYAMGAKAAEKAAADFDAQAKAWHDEVKADPELGGNNFDATLKHVAEVGKAIPEFKSVFAELEKWGAGNHPAFVRAFAKLGKLCAEDKFTSGADTAGKPVDRAKVLYPNMN